jgi:lipoprotein
MKQLMIIIGICILGVYGCHDPKVGFLKTDNAEYSPSILEVRRTLDPERLPDANMIETGAEWVSNEIGGVLGTNPLIFDLEDVTASDGGDAALFKEQVRVIGGGRVYFPSKDIKAPNGTYKLSIRVSNPGYSAVLKDIFTVIIKDN